MTGGDLRGVGVADLSFELVLIAISVLTATVGVVGKPSPQLQAATFGVATLSLIVALISILQAERKASRDARTIEAVVGAIDRR